MEVIKPKTKWAVRWYEDGVDEGREQGIERGIKQQLRLLRRLVDRKFGGEAVRTLAAASAPPPDPDFVEAVFGAAIDCDTADEFVAWMSAHPAPTPSVVPPA